MLNGIRVHAAVVKVQAEWFLWEFDLVPCDFSTGEADVIEFFVRHPSAAAGHVFH